MKSTLANFMLPIASLVMLTLLSWLVSTPRAGPRPARSTAQSASLAASAGDGPSAGKARPLLGSRTPRLAICPICVGLSGTWLWMLAARLAGVAVDETMLAIVIGASVVGGAQWVEARLHRPRSALLWKAIFLPAGFAAAYGLVAQQWGLAAAAAAVAAMLAVLFLRTAPLAARDPAAIARLQEQMKKCC